MIHRSLDSPGEREIFRVSYIHIYLSFVRCIIAASRRGIINTGRVRFTDITAVRPLIFRGENGLNPDIRPCVSLNELRRQLNMTNIFVTVDEWAESPTGRDYATLRDRG